MTITINGNGTVTGISVGGLPDGIVDTDMLAANAVATAKIADDAVTTAKSTVTPGITHLDIWHLATQFTGTAIPITAGWVSHPNTHGFEHLGTAMSQSSGIFTFPVTGYWWISFHASFRSTVEQDYVGTVIEMTQNNGTDDYPDASANYSHTSRTGGSNSVYSESHCNYIAKVTNLTNQKVRFGVELNDSNGVVRANATKMQTGAEFMRLGDAS